MIPSTQMVSWRSTWVVLATVAAAAFPPAQGASTSRAWFQTTEQSLMNAVAVGDRAPWNATLDDRCVLTTEEGEVLTKA